MLTGVIFSEIESAIPCTIFWKEQDASPWPTDAIAAAYWPDKKAASSSEAWLVHKICTQAKYLRNCSWLHSATSAHSAHYKVVFRFQMSIQCNFMYIRHPRIYDSSEELYICHPALSAEVFAPFCLCLYPPLFCLFPSVLQPLGGPPLTVYWFKFTSIVLSPCCWYFPAHNSVSASMADLQRAITYACGARRCGDLDGQGSHPHQCEAAGNAAGFLQIPATEYQTPRWCCAPHLVGSLFSLDQLLSPFDDFFIDRSFLNFRQDWSFICNI